MYQLVPLNRCFLKPLGNPASIWKDVYPKNLLCCRTVSINSSKSTMNIMNADWNRNKKADGIRTCTEERKGNGRKKIQCTQRIGRNDEAHVISVQRGFRAIHWGAHGKALKDFPLGVYISVIKRSRTTATDTMVQLSVTRPEGESWALCSTAL